MPLLKPDPTFYPSPTMAMQSPPEKLAYLALINPLKEGRPDAIGVVDVDPASKSYGRLVGQTDMSKAGDELHHFGWNACSSCLCPYAPHPHMERRYLVVPGINSSRIHILDTKPDPRQPKIVKVIEPETVAQRTGYAAPHTVHCGPDGVFLSALGAPDGNGPGGTFILDPETFDIRGRWEIDRGPQELAYDIWWHLGLDTMVTSTWGTPSMVKDGVNAELLLAGKYGHKLHMWDLRRRRHVQELELGAEQQMTLELRPAHDPTRAYGFVGVVLSLKDLSSSIWLWHREASGTGSAGTNGKWAIKRVIEIPAEPADPEKLPPRGVVVLAAGLAGLVVPIGALKIVVASILMMLGLDRLWRHRHPRFGGMQVGFVDLTVWSFLMASAHGAGFMVLPFVLGVPADVAAAASEHAGQMVARDTGVPWTNAMAVGVHTLAYLLVTALVASVVYQRLGLRLLRTAWINLDWLWAGALVITGAVVLLT